MAEVVMALDFSAREDFDFNNSVNQWFIDHEVQVEGESFSNGKDTLNYNHYEKFKVIIFNLDMDFSWSIAYSSEGSICRWALHPCIDS